jgi:hypothetical protein
VSTRSMTIVRQPYAGPDKFVPLYRHCDGYPAEAGKAVADVLATKPTCPEDILAGLLALRYEAGDPIYRAATWMPHEQGDLEHVYEIAPETIGPSETRVRPPVTSWTVKHYVRQGWGAGSDDYRSWSHSTMTEAEFAFFIDAEVKAQAKRLLAWQKQRGKS